VTSPRAHRAPLLALAVVAAAGGCLDHELDPADADGGAGGPTFLALQRDFQSFRSWRRLPVGAEAIDGGHDAGSRFVYASGSAVAGAFPVGTMIVKTVEDGAPTAWEIHARAKRGGGFNGAGAFGWEWFDLRIVEADAVVIMWRGEKPPKDHGYESLPGLGTTNSMDGDCNTCHAAASASDYVLSAPLRAELAGQP
jgi:hypothetical protein